MERRWFGACRSLFAAWSIVLLTDGEETCGGTPCPLAEQLQVAVENLTVHVIGYIAREAVSGRGMNEARCMAEQTGGLYTWVETVSELVSTHRKTLGYPLLSQAGD